MDNKLLEGPLHLQRYLAPCADVLVDVIRSSVHHPVNVIRSLHCQCLPNRVLKTVEPSDVKPIDPRIVQARQKNIESARKMAISDADNDRRIACRFFSLRLNDEDGVVHSTCRRCDRLILLYDRALYWGIKKTSVTVTPTFPYKCTCGGHAFEVALGIEYPDEAMDENDINTLTIAVRCASCNEIAIIFDDEAT
ncbi:MAG: hypothetical protein V1899_04695 [Planctomycetota bacterium]